MQSSPAVRSTRPAEGQAQGQQGARGGGVDPAVLEPGGAQRHEAASHLGHGGRESPESPWCLWDCCSRTSLWGQESNPLIAPSYFLRLQCRPVPPARQKHAFLGTSLPGVRVAIQVHRRAPRAPMPHHPAHLGPHSPQTQRGRPRLSPRRSVVGKPSVTRRSQEPVAGTELSRPRQAAREGAECAERSSKRLSGELGSWAESTSPGWSKSRGRTRCSSPGRVTARPVCEAARNRPDPSGPPAPQDAVGEADLGGRGGRATARGQLPAEPQPCTGTLRF